MLKVLICREFFSTRRFRPVETRARKRSGEWKDGTSVPDVPEAVRSDGQRERAAYSASRMRSMSIVRRWLQIEVSANSPVTRTRSPVSNWRMFPASA